jgi:hypothetical protein
MRNRACRVNISLAFSKNYSISFEKPRIINRPEFGIWIGIGTGMVTVRCPQIPDPTTFHQICGDNLFQSTPDLMNGHLKMVLSVLGWTKRAG